MAAPPAPEFRAEAEEKAGMEQPKGMRHESGSILQKMTAKVPKGILVIFAVSFDLRLRPICISKKRVALSLTLTVETSRVGHWNCAPKPVAPRENHNHEARSLTFSSFEA